MLDAEIEILQFDVEIGQNQLLPDELPDDARHLVAVELDDRVLDLDLGHRGHFPREETHGRKAQRPYSIGPGSLLALL